MRQRIWLGAAAFGVAGLVAVLPAGLAAASADPPPPTSYSYASLLQPFPQSGGSSGLNGGGASNGFGTGTWDGVSSPSGGPTTPSGPEASSARAESPSAQPRSDQPTPAATPSPAVTRPSATAAERAGLPTLFWVPVAVSLAVVAGVIAVRLKWRRRGQPSENIQTQVHRRSPPALTIRDTGTRPASVIRIEPHPAPLKQRFEEKVRL
jgi:hypothetical protein